MHVYILKPAAPRKCFGCAVEGELFSISNLKWWADFEGRLHNEFLLGMGDIHMVSSMNTLTGLMARVVSAPRTHDRDPVDG